MSRSLTARLPFFYGWVMLPVVMLTTMTTMPGQTYGVSVFYPYLRASLDLSASELSGAYMLGTLLAAIPMTAVGALMDRYGPRRTLTGVVLLFGLTCIGMAHTSGLFTVFVAFLFLRMLGQGAMSLLAAGTLSMWFHRRLGTVGGVNNLGMALAMGGGPALNLWLIHQYGWRWTYILFGIGVWVVMLPALLIFFRNRPEDLDQERDGGEGDYVAVVTVSENRAFTLAQALRTRSYWIFAGIVSAWSMIGTGTQFHAAALFASRGLTESATATMFSVFAGSVAVSRILGGILADRLRLNLLLAVSAAALCASMLVLNRASLAWLPYLYGLIMGMGSGLNIAVGEPLLVRYYGRRHLGKILGAGTTTMVASSSFGPFAMGLTYDLAGSYQPSIWAFFMIAAVLVPLGLLGTPPAAPATRKITRDTGNP